jgi:predicted AAA+ superfamily ATPase
MLKFIFYTSLNHDAIINSVYQLKEQQNKALYDEILGKLLQESYILQLDKNLFKMYLCHLIAAHENLFSLTAEKQGHKIDEKLRLLALRDMEHILALFNSNVLVEELGDIGQNTSLNQLYRFLNTNPSTHELCSYLMAYYEKFGAGAMNRFKAFKWDNKQGMIGIAHCDPITLNDLIGGNDQKEVLMKNTENFLDGKAANNALLFGDSGTGKSSCVKALLNAYHQNGLRLIELSKTDFLYFNKILSVLKDRGLKYIIFLDDLSFEEFETEYKYMKALIEGGVEIKPDNVLIYATSNRRHLIRETWNERQGEDIHIMDTHQEKLSLSDRFGLTLTFTAPNQKDYLEIVFELATKYKIELPQNLLREKAIKWELVHGGRSGRVARQFVNSLM